LQIINYNYDKFKEGTYSNDDVCALYFHWNPTEGPFILIPSLDSPDKFCNYKLTIFSDNPVELTRLDEEQNSVMIGRWV
jgi:hypothetical protein